MKYTRLFVPLLLTALALNLLYLFKMGAWYDPSRLIEVIELVVLAVLATGGAVSFLVEGCHLWNMRKE